MLAPEARRPAAPAAGPRLPSPRQLPGAGFGGTGRATLEVGGSNWDRRQAAQERGDHEVRPAKAAVNQEASIECLSGRIDGLLDSTPKRCVIEPRPESGPAGVA